MRTCTECRYAVKTNMPKLVRCEYHVPVWMKRELLSPQVGGELADHLSEYDQHDCPTFSPREEAQP